MRVPLPTGAIVGYTNAGKSSLLNRLTDANVAVEDKLFATLDPTTRRLELPSGHAVLLTDTVGFIRRLPHHLIEAFKATLEEAVFADFLLHVVDITSPEADRQAETTLEVLKELGAGEKPIITVYNKIDLIHEERLHDYRIHDDGDPAYASVKTGTGIESLITRIEYHVMSAANYIELLIPHHRYDMVARFHRDGHVDEEDPRDDGFYLKGSIEPRWMKPFEEFRIANRGRTIAGASEPQLR
jgi:GTP-binding protein HflX